MNVLKKWSFWSALLILCTCQNPSKRVNPTAYQSVQNGQYPMYVSHPTQEGSEGYFEIIDHQQEKTYPAQRLNDSILLFLAEKPNFKIEDDLEIQPAEQSIFDNQIKIVKTSEVLNVNKNEKPVLRYQIAKTLAEGKDEHYKRGGFIHPLYSPNGKILSDDFPEGHAHQHGIFFAFTNTTFKGERIDFWNQHKETGTIEFEKLINYEGGPVFGKFETEQNHISLNHGVVLKEHWVVTIYNTAPYRIDIQTTLQNITLDTLFIHEYLYGGMTFRGAKEWNAADSLYFQNEADFQTSEGLDRIEANHSRPLWSTISGLIDGSQAGAAMFGHSTNFRHPEPIRIHPEMPYYCIAPMVAGEFTMIPNETFEATYSYLSFDGEVPTNLLNALTKPEEKK